MPLSIANNSSSFVAQHNLRRSANAFKSSLEKLSSGLQVNRGADGPAALVISEKQRAQIAGLHAAIDNSEKAAALVQTAEGALSEINGLLVKVRSLAIDSANDGVMDANAQAANQAEIDNALLTIDRISQNTQFGTKRLLDGSAGIQGVASSPEEVRFLKATTNTQEGIYAVTVDAAATRAVGTALTAQTGLLASNETLTINGVNVELTAGMNQDQVIDRVNEFTGQTGVMADNGGSSGETRLFTKAFGSIAALNVMSDTANSATSSGFGTSPIGDTGDDVAVSIDGNSYTGRGNVLNVSGGPAKGLSLLFAEDASDVTNTVSGSLGTLTVSDRSLVFQIGPNAQQNTRVALDRADSSSLGLGVINNQFANLSEIDVMSAAKANDSLAVIDMAINDVSGMRGNLGAFQANTLEATMRNMEATLENTINAESVIRDTDFATEIANFTKQQVLQQAGASVLRSANQFPQLILSLLG